MSSTYTERVVFIQKILGKGQISRDGNDVTVACPFCKTPGKKKLAINLENWKFHCWVCSSRGNSLVPLIRKFGTRETLDYYRSHYLNDKILSTDIEIEEKITLPDGFRPLVNQIGSKDPDIRMIFRYLAKRSVSEDMFWKYRIGSSDDPKFKSRAVFASLDIEGQVNYYVSRNSDEKSRFRYLNANNDKTAIIFNDIDIDWDKPIHLVEGVFDLMTLNENGTCLLGSSLTEKSLLFKKIAANQSQVILCLDNDMIVKTGKIADLLSSYGCDVSIMNTGAAKDIAEMSKPQLDEAKQTLTAWNQTASFRYKIASIKSGSMF